MVIVRSLHFDMMLRCSWVNCRQLCSLQGRELKNAVSKLHGKLEVTPGVQSVELVAVYSGMVLQCGERWICGTCTKDLPQL